MTLVIAQRLNNKVSFSSDSRLSFGTEGYFDYCIKIFKVRCRLRGPVEKLEDFEHWEFENDYGIAVIGSSINAYTIKDSVSELISNLQYLSGHSDISMAGIAQIVMKVYSRVSSELSRVLREYGICELLISGYCLVSKKIRVFHFYTTVTPDGLIFVLEEILQTDGMLFFGSAAGLAERISRESETLTPLEIIKKAVVCHEDAKIGGDLQNGYISDQNFKVTGVWEKSYDEQGQEIISKQTLRGFTLDPIDSMMQPPYLYISYQYSPVEPPKMNIH